MKIYISGPITGTKDAGPRFTETENKLRGAYPDAEFINPVRVAATLPELSHREYMIISFACMDVCDAMYQMPGWENSDGCNQEFGYAFHADMPILPSLEEKGEDNGKE